MVEHGLLVYFALTWAASCGAEDVEGGIAPAEFRARVSFPYHEALIRANVPIYGIAWCPDFDHYRLEFGEGESPTEWILIQDSNQPEPNDPWSEGRVVWNPDWGGEGNLGNWETGLDEYPYGQAWKHNLRGLYTLRLTVFDKAGKSAEHAIRVTVGRVLTNLLGGYGESPDGLVRFEVGPESLLGSFVLVSLLPTRKPKLPDDRILVGNAYEFRPPHLRLVRPATLTFKYEAKVLGSLGPDGTVVSPSQLTVCAMEPITEGWKPLPSRVSADLGTVTAEIMETQPYVSYYALMADVISPDPPAMPDLRAAVQTSVLRVPVTAEPDSTVIFSVNEGPYPLPIPASGEAVARLQLKPGANLVSARCRDFAGNFSAPSRASTVVLEYKHPRAVKEIKILGWPEAQRGQKFLVKVVGEDASPDVDTTLVSISSTRTDPEGIMFEAVETGAETGTYVAVFAVGAASDSNRPEIDVRVEGEEIAAGWVPDGAIRASKIYRDKVGPSRPIIEADQQKTFLFHIGDDAIEKPEMGAFSPEGNYGARAFTEQEGNNFFLRMRKDPPGSGNMGSVATSQEYSVGLSMSV